MARSGLLDVHCHERRSASARSICGLDEQSQLRGPSGQRRTHLPRFSLNRGGDGYSWCCYGCQDHAELIMVTDEVWKLPAIVNRYLSYRAAIPMAQEQIGVMMSILKTKEGPLKSFLDLGCGDGILGATLLGEYPTAHGVFVDFSEPMLAQAHEQLKDYADHLAFEKLDYGDPAWLKKVQTYGPFDAIVSGYSIHHQPDSRKRRIYEEIFQLMEPGGWFINIEHMSSASQLNNELFENHYVSSR